MSPLSAEHDTHERTVLVVVVMTIDIVNPWIARLSPEPSLGKLLR